MALSIDKPKLDNLAGEIWKSAERLRGKFKAYEYQNVILPIIVIRRLECVLIAWRDKKREEVLAKRPTLGEQELDQLVKNLDRITDSHRAWIEERYRRGWEDGYSDEQGKIFQRSDFAYHKVGVVFWQSDESDRPATITEPYDKAFTAANLKKEQEFYDSDLPFRVSLKTGKGEETRSLRLTPRDNGAKKFKTLMEDKPEVLSIERTHRHYVKDDEYIPHGEDIETFLKREIAKPIIRWQDSATSFVVFMLEALRDTLQQLSTDQVTDQVKSLLRLLTKGDLTLAEAMKGLSLSHRPTFRSNYVQPALKMGLIEMTQPDAPRSPTQRYRLTMRGWGFLEGVRK